MAALADEHRVYLSVGSNLGDKLDNCQKGISLLVESGQCRLLKISRFYRTSPVDFIDQAWFVNAAVMIGTDLDPLALLDRLLAIQQGMGRKPDTVRFGPRIVDLDILLFDDRILQTPRLVIPHPRMHKRAFVLQPICDINPTVIHPVMAKTAAQLLDGLDDDAQRVVPLDRQPASPKGRVP
jgi:2-amino-4-hydroxy-6-hydroxymethyldihydropteridine diphosphokinase